LKLQPLDQHINLSNIKLHSREVLKNPHSWILLFLLLLLFVLYYWELLFATDRFDWSWYITVFEFHFGITGSLFYIPLIYTIVILGWRQTIVVWLLSMIIIFPRLVYYAFNLNALISNILFLSAPLMLVLLILLVWQWIQREKNTLIEKEAERQNYLSLVFKAHEEERKHIAQMLHDETIQTLLATSNRLQSVLNTESENLSPILVQQLDYVARSVATVAKDLRRLSIDLRPSILDDLGLIDAVRWLVNKLDSKTVKSSLIMNGEQYKLSSSVDLIIFRFVQEALNNIIRHAEATEVIVNIYYDKNIVQIKVQDNGKGFICPDNLGDLTANGKLGIMGMVEKASFLGGKFNIDTQPGKGTIVSIEFKTNEKITLKQQI
jgi:two-component system, NarL family, sensor histidine kinase DegS